ncbi:MAG TPA: MAPEG family protein [Polyangiaceae bacterium]|nr:MAPEG family protein [Polyangiaceae bacterium]
MSGERIFWPITTLALWTGFVLLVTAYGRIGAVLRGQLRSNAFKIGESPEVPKQLLVGNRNFMNLLEMPVLFYVVCISLYVTKNVDTASIWLAWLYVLLRVLHSVIHLSYNHVVHRLLAFTLSNVTLTALWAVFIVRLSA